MQDWMNPNQSPLRLVPKAVPFEEGQLFRKPFNPVLAVSREQAARGDLMTYAVDFLAVLKEAGCDPSEGFAVASLLETLVREDSKVVDVSDDECDLVWKD